MSKLQSLHTFCQKMNVIFKLSVFYGSIVAFNFDQIIGEKIVHKLGQISNIVTAQCVILQNIFFERCEFRKINQI